MIGTLRAATAAAVAGLLGLAVAGAAYAAPFDETPCAEDVQKICGHQPPGWGPRGQCLLQNLEHTGDECEQFLREREAEKHARMIERQRTIREKCGDDIEKLCAQFKDNRRATAGCLDRKRDELSPACEEVAWKRNQRTGPGYFGWKDGSEPADFDLQRDLKLRPRKTREKMLAEQAAAEAAESGAPQESAPEQESAADAASEGK